MREFKNSMLVTWICIAIALIVIVLNFWDVFPRNAQWWAILLIVIAAILYIGFLVLVIISPLKPDPDFYDSEQASLSENMVSPSAFHSPANQYAH